MACPYNERKIDGYFNRLTMAFQLQALLNHWYRRPGQQALLGAQKALLDEALTQIFGFYLVQLGAPWPEDLLRTSRIDTRIVCERAPVRIDGMDTVVADVDYLPFSRESVDAVVLPHTLEAVDDPYHLLRQVDRILVLDGHVIITGFNPNSPANWRIRWFGRERKTFARLHWLRMHRVVDWLNLMGYEIKLAQHIPSAWLPQRFSKQAERLDYLLEKSALHPGRLYGIVAQKRSVPLTPSGLNWKLANWLPINKGSWVPTRRILHRSVHEKS
ncbi:MAG TPA: methyltransferase domain-containing protein [Sulfurivirga caldicuralii]|nr:methyltransferase domain-containing protein [Sulfurivirga caldicuralii]